MFATYLKRRCIMYVKDELMTCLKWEDKYRPLHKDSLVPNHTSSSWLFFAPLFPSPILNNNKKKHSEFKQYTTKLSYLHCDQVLFDGIFQCLFFFFLAMEYTTKNTHKIPQCNGAPRKTHKE
jgi:hypothetical protein